MKLTSKQLRRIIKEELDRSTSELVKSYLEKAKDAVTKAQSFMNDDDQSKVELEQAWTLIDAVYSDYHNPALESKKSSSSKNLSESYTRITDTEMKAWKNGDWGFVSEGIQDPKEMSATDAAQFISSQPGDTSSPSDIIDAETGEIYLTAGELYGSSDLHPDADVRYADFAAKSAAESDEEEKQWAAEDAQWDDQKQSESGSAREEYDAAVQDFASGFSNYAGDYGISSEDIADSAQDVASDAALGFFHAYPEWDTWARKLHLSKQDIQSACAGEIAEVIAKHTRIE